MHGLRFVAAVRDRTIAVRRRRRRRCCSEVVDSAADNVQPTANSSSNVHPILIKCLAELV